MLLDVVVPDGTVGIHKQDVAPANAPPRPDGDMQADRRNHEGEKRKRYNCEKHRCEWNDERNLPPLGFWFLGLLMACESA